MTVPSPAGADTYNHLNIFVGKPILIALLEDAIMSMETYLEEHGDELDEAVIWSIEQGIGQRQQFLAWVKEQGINIYMGMYPIPEKAEETEVTDGSVP